MFFPAANFLRVLIKPFLFDAHFPVTAIPLSWIYLFSRLVSLLQISVVLSINPILSCWRTVCCSFVSFLVLPLAYQQVQNHLGHSCLDFEPPAVVSNDVQVATNKLALSISISCFPPSLSGDGLLDIFFRHGSVWWELFLCQASGMGFCWAARKGSNSVLKA